MFPKKEEFNKIIESLKEFDLSTYPETEVYEALKKIQTFPIITYPLPIYTPITRVRPNKDGERFSNQHEIWHKPDDLNKTYQRASNPGINMFYGAIIPDEDNDRYIESERITSCLEATQLWYKETEDIETEVITFSRWNTTRDLNIVAVFDFEELNHKNKIFNSIENAYQEVIDQNEDLEFYIKSFNKLMASEFSKYPIEENYQYLISSIFSEMVVRQGFDGILYPSTKTDLKGYNVALNSAVVPKALNLFVVCECRHYRLGKESIINNEMLTSKVREDGSFKLEEVEDSRYRLTEEAIVQELKRRNKNI